MMALILEALRFLKPSFLCDLNRNFGTSVTGLTLEGPPHSRDAKIIGNIVWVEVWVDAEPTALVR